MSEQANLPDHVKEPSPPAIKNAGMTPGNAIGALVPQSLDDAFRLSKALASSGDMVPKHFQGKPEMVMAAIVRGMEIGLAPMQALSNIAVINGRASLWGDAMPALMQRAGHHIDVELTGEGDDMVATATLTRGDTGKTVVRTFSVEDAKKANLWGKAGPWQQYPKRMLSNRARAWAVRDGAADALMGLQIAEETSDYHVKDVTPKVGGFAAKAQQARQEPEAPEDAQEVEPDATEPHWTETASLDEAFPGSESWAEGEAAHAAGTPRTECPHADNAARAADWLAAYDAAEEAK